MSVHKNTTAIIIGGGLVGSLCACFLAKRAYEVNLYEYRGDIRTLKQVQGRSINLALSNRGRRALRSVGLEDEVLKNSVPMKGRLLHTGLNSTKGIPYDIRMNQCIYSVGRNILNKLLLNAAESYGNVELHFHHKMINSMANGEVVILNTKSNETIHVEADLIIGADGAFSALRRCMQQTPLFEFSQTYIEHGYIELCIPAERYHLLTPKYLHIWPRKEFMMIALPNMEGSWTVTLFMPFKQFQDIDSEVKLLKFFADTFPDAISLIGKHELEIDFFKAAPSSLLSLRCSPYHEDNKILIGDAAHAIVPFYGQGMNAGFEDCIILDELLEIYKPNIRGALAEFTSRRKEDAYAISDLSMYNYKEMRDLVTRSSYSLRNLLDRALYTMLPDKWVPLYNTVTFSDMGYANCFQNRKWQNEMIRNGILLLFVVFVSALILLYS